MVATDMEAASHYFHPSPLCMASVEGGFFNIIAGLVRLKNML